MLILQEIREMSSGERVFQVVCMILHYVAVGTVPAAPLQHHAQHAFALL